MATATPYPPTYHAARGRAVLARPEAAGREAQ